MIKPPPGFFPGPEDDDDGGGDGRSFFARGPHDARKEPQLLLLQLFLAVVENRAELLREPS